MRSLNGSKLLSGSFPSLPAYSHPRTLPLLYALVGRPQQRDRHNPGPESGTDARIARPFRIAGYTQIKADGQTYRVLRSDLITLCFLLGTFRSSETWIRQRQRDC